MPSVKRLQWFVEISAGPSKVYEAMIGAESYKVWAAAFAEGSTFDGSWQVGQSIRFLSPSGDGMISEIAANRPNEFVSIRHLGFILNGVEDTSSESIRAWAPAYENYSLAATPNGTRLTIDQDVAAEWESYMLDAWPKALELLKQLCESNR
jgi:hypothetical protein